MRTLAAALTIALAVAAAGCSADESGGTAATHGTGTAPTTGAVGGTGPGNATQPPQVAEHWLKGCDQWHGFFTFPAAAFEGDGFLPTGFTLATGPGGATTDVFVDTGRCLGGGPGVFAAHLFVVPPPDLDQGADDLDLYTFLAATDNATLLAYLAGTGQQQWTTGTFSYGVAPPTPGATVENAAIDTPSVDFNLEFTSRPATGPFDATYRLWHKGPDGAADGHLEWDNGNATTIGEGEAVYSASSLDGGPPALSGLLHRVSGADVRIRWIPVAP